MTGESYKNIFLFLIILLVGFIICMGSTYAADTNGSCNPNCLHINSTNVESNYISIHENLNGSTEYYNSTISTLKCGDEDNDNICCYNEESNVNNCTFEKSNNYINYSTNQISVDCSGCIESISSEDTNSSCSSNCAHMIHTKIDRYDDTHVVEPKDTSSTSIYGMSHFKFFGYLFMQALLLIPIFAP